MKALEIRELDSDQIISKLESAHQELFNLKIGFQTGSVDDPGQIKRLQKDVARMLTILRERELAAELVGGESPNVK